jgi:hypothetical protein
VYGPLIGSDVVPMKDACLLQTRGIRVCIICCIGKNGIRPKDGRVEILNLEFSAKLRSMVSIHATTVGICSLPLLPLKQSGSAKTAGKIDH